MTELTVRGKVKQGVPVFPQIKTDLSLIRNG